ncbi:MAG: DUF4367 domain-containing protein [bacterium]|nr:DUF4367 domain-containing protein [bacterium]
MGKLSNTVEINGKRYDVHTGKLVTGHSAAPVITTPNKAQAIDGVVRRSSAANNPHRTIEKSKTLMRHAVKKPLTTPHASTVKAVTPIGHKDLTSHKPKSTNNFVHSADIGREARAAKVKRSSLVSKFSDFKQSIQSDNVQHMPVKPVPAHAKHASATESTSHHQKSHEIIEKGLKNAQSHHQPYVAPSHKHRTPKAKRTRLASIGAGSMAVLLLVGFYTFQNIPNLAMRYATTRSGINASLPGYKPAGFALNSHIHYNPGQITVEFKSNTDERAFTITQRESAWNSDTLRQNYVASASDQVHTYEDKGQTIYLYGGSNATWVNGGVWYEIKGDSQLNSDQLVRIATSM